MTKALFSHSQHLSLAEENYDVGILELLAVLLALQEWIAACPVCANGKSPIPCCPLGQYSCKFCDGTPSLREQHNHSLHCRPLLFGRALYPPKLPTAAETGELLVTTFSALMGSPGISTQTRGLSSTHSVVFHLFTIVKSIR